jgi:hypothetical protein
LTQDTEKADIPDAPGNGQIIQNRQKKNKNLPWKIGVIKMAANRL